MAQQNKSVIAAIAVLAVLVIGVGSYFLFSGPAQQAAHVVTPLPPEEPAPAPAKAEEKNRRGRRGSEDEAVKEETKTTATEELPPEELAKKRGPTNKPRGVMP